MGPILFCLFLFALWFVFRVIPRTIQHASKMNVRDEEIDRLQRVLEFDPTNSGSRAQLAGILIDDGDLEAGIHEYRTAISQSPHGPFATEWKRKLKRALEVQAQIASGEKPMEFNDWRVCGQCQATVSVKKSVCPKCGFVLQKGFFEFTFEKDTQREIWREAIPITVVLIIVICVFVGLPMEWQGVLICSAVMVGGWMFLKSFDGAK